jgi:hypothetical protein
MLAPVRTSTRVFAHRLRHRHDVFRPGFVGDAGGAVEDEAAALGAAQKIGDLIVGAFAYRLRVSISIS